MINASLPQLIKSKTVEAPLQENFLRRFLHIVIFIEIGKYKYTDA